MAATFRLQAAALALVALLWLPLAPVASAQSLKDIFSPRDEASKMTVDHFAWGSILEQYLVPGPDGVNRFAYGKIGNFERAKIKTYLIALGNVDPAKLNSDEQRAYWINAYNALTVDVVLDNYPVKSIRDIRSGLFSIGPWKRKLFTVKGQQLSLDDIEHEILRKVWSDARIHFAVNCASIGCPNLQPKPFAGATLNAQLDQAAKDYVNHPRGLSVGADGRVTASRIFDWYGDDFGKDPAERLAYLLRFANPALKAKLKGKTAIDAYDYDWSLNDAK